MLAMSVILLLFVSRFVGWTEADDGVHLYSGDDKIVGGEIVKSTEHSLRHVASLQIQIIDNSTTYRSQPFWSHICGASIFAASYVITACHCVIKKNAVTGLIETLESEYPLHKWRVTAGTAGTAGTANILQDESNVQVRRPATVRYHPSCNHRNKAYDVAVAKLYEPFIFNTYVSPVGIYSWDHETFESRLDGLIFNTFLTDPPPCFMAGFGTKNIKSIAEENDETKSTTAAFRARPAGDPWQLKTLQLYPMYEGKCVLKLMQVMKAAATNRINTDDFLDTYVLLKIKLVGTHTTELSQEDTSSADGYGEVFHNQICALSKFSNESSCTADGGSGLLCDNYLIGIESWNLGCAAGDPDMFQNLLTVLDWIRKEICRLQTCSDALTIRPDCYPPLFIREFLEKYCTRTIHPTKKSLAPRVVSSLWIAALLASIIQQKRHSMDCK